MKYFYLYFLILLTSKVIAYEDCSDTQGSLKDIITVTGKKCLSDDLGKDDLHDLLGSSPKELSSFCDNCKSEILISSVKQLEGKEEKESILGRAALDEFQKELTFISLELMKTRSSFGLDFDPKEAISSCKFDNSHLKKPSCLSKEQGSLFDKETKKIQDSVATELANILSQNPQKDGLLTRKDRTQCDSEISERGILYAQSHFLNSKLTPELIGKLKNVIATEKDPIKFLQTNEAWEKEVKRLEEHPLFNLLLKDQTNLQLFLSEVSSTDSNAKIIDTLYKSKYTQLFGDSIKSRCEVAFKNTSDVLETIYCKDSPRYVPDTLSSMEAIVGTQFRELRDEEAEEKLQLLCAYLKADENNSPKSFSSIRKLIHGENKQKLVNAPLGLFKTNAYDHYLGQDQEALCLAKNGTPPCTPDNKSEVCQKLAFIELSKSNPEHKELASGSAENINLILRSLIGAGLPQKNGQLDSKGYALLQSEGIIPSSTASYTPKPQRDAGSFYRATSSGTTKSSSVAGVTPVAPSQTSVPNNHFNPTTPTYTSTPELKQAELTPTSPTSAPTKTQNGTPFSHLSQSEQEAIMRRLGKSAAANKKSSNPAIKSKLQEADTSEINPEKFLGKNGSFTTDQEDSKLAAMKNTERIQEAPTSTGKATLDKNTKKVDSLNEAKISAQEFVAKGSPSAPTVTGTGKNQLTTRVNDKGQNEIRIEVEDQELQRVNEFKKKLTELLDAQRYSLADAKTGKAFIVQLGHYKITVALNSQGNYVAECPQLPKDMKDYLTTLSSYFTKIKSGDRPTLKSVQDSFQAAKSNN